MNQIKQFLLENWYNLAVIISSIATYMLTRRITVFNNNKDSLEYQLRNIYKPLVVYFRYHQFSDIHEIMQFYALFHGIIVENYEYITSDLLTYESNLLLSIEKYNFSSANDICDNINKYCVSKYNVICYKLNLPSMSNKGANLLISRSDKLFYFFNKLFDPWFLLLSFHICFLNIGNLFTTIFFNFSFAKLVYSNIVNFLFSFVPTTIIFLMLRYRK